MTRAAFLVHAAALAVWGGFAGLPVAGGVCAAVVAGAGLLRLAPGPRDWSRVLDLSVVLLVAGAVWVFQTTAERWPLELLRLLPPFLVPAVALQAAARQGRFLVVRTRRFDAEQPHGTPGWWVDLGPPLVLVCLLAATVGQPPDTALFAAGAALLAALAATRRAGAWPLPALLAAVVLAAGLGWGLQAGMTAARPYVRDWVRQNLGALYDSDVDPYRTVTRLGSVGRRKLGHDVVARVTGPAARPGLLLRRGVYNRFLGDAWVAAGADFDRVEGNGGRWRVAGGSAGARVRITARAPDGAGVLGLPRGTRVVRGLDADGMARNGLGSVRVNGVAAPVRYGVRFRPGRVDGRPPDGHDYRLPRGPKATLDRLVAKLGLHDLPPRRRIARVRRFLRHNFDYSLAGAGGPAPDADAVRRFLTERRAGHCEHFATAAALLLRAAGVPTRYVVGWSVQEQADLGDGYVVRQRHGHAWAVARADGRWITVDATPASWPGRDAAGEPVWQPALDALAWARWRWTVLRQEGLPAPWRYGLLVLAGVLVAVLAGRTVWRLRPTAAARRTRAGRDAAPDTDLRRAEAVLARAGHRRPPGRPLGVWLHDLHAAGTADVADLLPLVPLHNRVRFGPADDAERRRLAEGVGAWVRRS